MKLEIYHVTRALLRFEFFENKDGINLKLMTNLLRQLLEGVNGGYVFIILNYFLTIAIDVIWLAQKKRFSLALTKEKFCHNFVAGSRLKLN